MNEKFNELYSYLKDNGMTDLDANSFYKKYSDPVKSKEIHSYLKSNKMTDLDETSFHSSYFGGKKKEPTVSNSPSDQKPTSSATPDKKPSGQSDYLSPTSDLGPKSPKMEFDYKTKKESVVGEYKGYPGKEENTYRVYNGNWQRKMPNQTKWQDVLNEGSVNALNKQFNQAVKYSKAQDKYKGVVEDKRELAKKELDTKLSTINSNLVDKEENVVVPTLQKQFPDFKFAPNGTFTDEVKVIAPNNETIIISLDNWSSSSDASEAELLRSFIRMNSNTDKNEAEKTLQQAEKQREFFDIKPFNPTIKIGEGYGDEQIVTDLNKVVQPEGVSTDIMTADKELKSARKEYMKQSEMAYTDVIDKVRVAAKTTGKVDDKEAAADLAMIKADWREAKAANDYFNDISTQGTELKKEWTDLQTYVDGVNAKLSTGEITQEQYDSEYVPLMKKGLEDLQNRSSVLNNEYTTVQNVSSSIERSAAENMIIQESRGSIAGGIAHGFTKGLTDVLRVATLGNLPKEAQEDLVRAVVGYGTTEEYMNSEERSDITKVLFSLSRTLGQAATGSFIGKGAALAGGSAKAVTTASAVPFFSSGYYEMKDQFDDPKFANISDAQKVLFSALYGTASAALEKYGLTKSVSKTPFGKNLTNTILASAIKGLPKNASEEAIKEAIEASIVNKIKSAGVSSLGAFVVEGATEATQKATEIALKESFDALNENNYFESGTAWNMLSDVIYEGYLGGLGGSMMNVAASGARIATNGISKVINEDQAKVLDIMTQTEGMNESFDTYLKGLVVSGDITPDEAGSMSKGFREVKAGFDKIPADIPVDQKTKAFDLIVERSKIEKEISGKEDNLVVAQKERIKEINTELQTISTESVQPVVAEKETVDTVTDTDTATKETVVTDEVTEADPKVYSDALIEAKAEMSKSGSGLDLQVSDVTEQEAKDIIDEGGKVFMTEDGKAGAYVKKDGYMGGLFKSPKSEMKEVAKLLQDARVKAGGYFMDAYGTKLEDIYIKNGFRPVARLKFNEEYAPEGWDAEGSPLKDKPDVVFFTYDPTGKYSKGDGEYVADYDTAYEMAKSSKNVAQEVEAIGQLLSGTDQEIDQKASKVVNKKISKAVANAAKSVSKIIPGTKFVVHDTDESYRAATKEEGKSQSSNGEFNPATNTIHINGTKANSKTVAHEVFHAILINKVKTDANAAAVTKRMVEAISAKIENNPSLKKKLDDFVSNYDENIQNEEKLAELVGILAENYNSFSAQIKDLIARWIDKIASMVGRDPFDRSETYDILKTIAKKVAKGKEISESDINMMSITGVTTDIIKSSKPKKQIKVSKNQKLTFVTKEDLIDIDSLINDISSKGEKVWFWTADQLGRGNYFDSVLNGEHFLDAGPSFALDPENRSNNVIWASGANKKTLENNIAKSDYIFIISGSPQKSKLFNKTVANLIRRRIEGAIDFKGFKKELLEANPTSKIKSILDKYNSYEDLFMGADRKNFIIAINEQQTKNTPANKVLERYNAFVDPDGLRDGFYQDNNFEMGDIMLVLKADKLGNKSKHSTYETDILGSVVGVPDSKVNAYDIMPAEIKDKYRDDMSRSEQSQVVAPYGIGIKEISPRKQLSTEVSNKLTEDKKGNFVFHHYSGDRRNEIKPGTGENIITGKEESGALSAVGGLAMYYTMDNQVEPGVGNTLHTVLVPSGKVYDFNQDPDNFYDEAKKRFEAARPSQSFSPNYQLAFVTQVANENGYDMVVARWRNNELRAQTTIPLKPSSENIRMKPIEEELFKVGDDVEVYGSKGKVVSIDGDIITFKGDGVGGEINFKRFPKNISKQITPRKQIAQEVSSIEESMVERKQKVTSINDIVRITKDKGFSDAAIRQYLKDQGFSDKQATAAINEYNVKKEGIFVRKDGGIPTKIVDSIRSFRRRMLSARAFLPKSVFSSREDKDASVARHLNIVDQNVKDFNRLYAKYKGDKDALVAEFDKYIRGDKDAKLPEEFMTVANSMRNQIDGLSMQLINNGLVDADMAQTIKDNLGQYLTRSYKIYDRENWKKEVEDEVKQKAINLLKSQYREMAQEISNKEGIPLDEVLDNLVTNRLDEMLTTEGAKNFITGSKLGSKDLSVLKERQDIPVEIRMLLGEYSDPALNYAKTILKLSSIAANHKFLTEVKKNGTGVYLFEKNDPRRPADFNTMIAAEGSESMNPLNGMYTTKEIADAFMAQPSQLSDFWKTFMKFQSTVRWLKTIGSVATHIKNVFGNIGFIWINAHFDPKEIRKSYTTIKEDLMPYGTYLERGRRKVLGQKQKEVDEVARKMMNNYIALGIVKQSAGLGEVMDMFKDANWDIAMASRLSNQKLGLFGKAKRIFLQGKKKIEDTYQAEDDFFKIVAYENELSRYSEAMFGKNKSELTEDELAEVNKVVTEIVKNTYPTYDRIPEAVKMVRRAPFIGNFVSFQAESYRTAFNTMALAKNELMSDNNKIKAIGAQRLAGATTYLSAKSAILAYFSMAAGTGLTGLAGYLFDDEDEDKRDKDIRKFVAPWSEKSDLLMISVGDGKMKYIDFSSSDPHGGMKKVLNAFFLGETTIDSFSAGIVETFAPFIGEDMTVEALLALKNNQDKYGNPIYNTEESLRDQSEKVLSYMYKLVEPGTFSSIRRGMEAEDKTNELVANITGFRTYDVDINKQFGYKMKDYSERISNAKKIYNQAYFNEKSTEADKEKAYKKAQESLNGIYTEITEVYNSAERLGCDPKDLGTVMADFGNMSKRTVRDIQSGSLPELKKKD